MTFSLEPSPQPASRPEPERLESAADPYAAHEVGAVCVTGATGCLGSALLRVLSSRGYVVVALSRRRPDGDAVTLPGVQFKVGELSDPSYLSSAVAGARCVVHLAGLVHVDEGQAGWSDYYQANVDLARRVFEAGRAAGVARFVFVSSIVAHGASSHDGRLTEDSPLRPLTMYGRSKVEAEQVLRRLAASGPPDLVVVRPSLVYGERDRGNFMRMLRAISRGRFMLPSGGDVKKSVCYSGNLAHALLLTMNDPAAVGRAYLLADEPTPTLREIVRLVRGGLKALGVPTWPVAAVPRPVLGAAGRLGDASRALGLPSPVTTAQVRTLLRSVDCDTTRIRTELGYVPPLSFADGVRRTLEWATAQGSI